MSNYPPGAACDPQAPYNQDPAEEVSVLVTETLEKWTAVTPPPLNGWRGAEAAEDTFLNQQRSASECLRDCASVLRMLTAKGTTSVTGTKSKSYYLPQLLADCEYWERVSLKVEER